MKNKTRNVLMTGMNKRIAAYSLGAGATMMASPGAQANIIWSGDISIDFGSSETVDWTIEGVLSETRLIGFNGGNSAHFGVSAFAPHDKMQFAGPVGIVALLSASQSIPSALNFVPNAYFFFRTTYFLLTPNSSFSTAYFNTTGAWTVDGQRGFFGFSFILENESASGAPEGTMVYGWAEMERISASEGRLLQWAYDDTGAPIQVGVVPEPNTLGLLALGAAGIAAMRRRRHRD